MSYDKILSNATDSVESIVSLALSSWHQEAINDELKEPETDSVDALMMGMASQICEREDNIVTPDLRGSVYGPLEFSRRDQIALDIQV